METANIERMSFYRVDIDPIFLAGMVRLYRSATGGRVADIFYAQKLGPPEMRVVCTKEMIHVADGDPELAQTKAQVNTLIDELVVPPELARSIPAQSDGRGLLYALAVLLPRDALFELRPAFEAGKISVEDIAKYTVLPESYVRFALTDKWQEVLEEID
jgi:hypothetical protein